MSDMTETETTVLESISKRIFGEGAKLEIADPRSLVILKKNARVFKKDVFRQLTDNIRKDGRLSSMPLCRRMEDGNLEVLSGNHRVQASIQANLPTILVMVIEAELSRAEQIAIQLSHNALVGEDDKALLAELWSEIEDIEAKLYAGLSSDVVEQLAKVDLVSFTTPQVASRVVTFAFVEDEAERLNAVLESLEAVPAKEVFVQSIKHFDRFFELLEQAKKKCSVRNTSLAMLQIVELCEKALAEMPDPALAEKKETAQVTEGSAS